MNVRLDSSFYKNKRVLLRVDLNLPTMDGEILSLVRWKRVLPTIQMILAANPKHLIVLSHFGQPVGVDPQFSLSHVLEKIKADLPEIKFIKSFEEARDKHKVYLYENVRFDAREKTLDADLIKCYLRDIDCVVFDAFSVGHRKHASVCGIMTEHKESTFGPLFIAEKDAIDQAMKRHGNRIAIISGAKISTKLPVLKKMLEWADHIIVGGAIANTCLSAAGINMRASLMDQSALETAHSLLKHLDKIILPIDGVTQQGEVIDFNLKDVGKHNAIMDIGPKTCARFSQYIENTDTIIWNGPLGYYEDPRFQKGTQHIALTVAGSSAYSVVGGGDSVAAIESLGISDQINYVSTSGGAFLQYVANGTLPVLDAVSGQNIPAAMEGF